MFDGAPDSPWRAPRAQPPHPLDTRTLLPLLRVQSGSAAIEALAVAAAHNAIQAACWAALRWGPDADYAQRGHPYHIAALDPATPAGKASEALVLLADACERHRSATGEDGLALAHAALATRFGATLADHVLKPLLDMAAARQADDPRWRELDALIAGGDAPTSPAPAEPTVVERAAAVAALLDLAFDDTRLAGLRAALERWSSANPHDDGGPAGDAVRAALESAAGQGVGQAELQGVLDVWADATGARRIALRVVD